MAFTYDPTLASDRDMVRFELGDIVISPSGVMPDGTNVPDETIAALLTKHSDNTDLVFITLCKAIGAAWATAATEHSADGLTVKRGDTAKRWADMAINRQIETGVGMVAYAHEAEADEVTT